jgi:hypothetical protein
VADESLKVTDSAWEWTPQRTRAALAVAESATVTDAAKAAGVTRETIHRWLKHPEFRQRIDEHLEEVISTARYILRRNAAAAALQLVHLHTSGNAMHTVKLAATKDILDRAGLKSPEKHEHTITPERAAAMSPTEIEAELKKRGLL